MKIERREIGSGSPPYVIAELSANHNGRIENALQLIEEAARPGADAVKIQTYTPDTMTLDCDSSDFLIEGGLWDGWSLYKLYDWAQTPWDWHKPLFDHARKSGITIFSTPFDASAVDLLEDLGSPAYKIASFECVDLPLITYVASTGKPMIISTGMADINAIQEAIDAARDGGCRSLAILHCVSGYPAPASDYNLQTITDMKERFGVTVGISDHTLTNATAIASVSLGASIIEKHFTLDRNGGGPDDSFSLEPQDLMALCRDVRTAWEAKGSVSYGVSESEKSSLQFRRSLYFVRNMQPGELITADCVRSVRPGFGLPPKHLHDIVGKKVRVAVKANTPVTEEQVKL